MAQMASFIGAVINRVVISPMKTLLYIKVESGFIAGRPKAALLF